MPNPFQNPGSAASNLGIHRGLFWWFEILQFHLDHLKIQSHYSRDGYIQLKVRPHGPHKLKTVLKTSYGYMT